MIGSSIHNVRRLALVLLLTLALLGTSHAQAPTGLNSNDPWGSYGLCLPGPSGIGSAIASKISHIYAVGDTAVNILAIVVLKCATFTGGGPTVKVPCPSGSPYAYCVRNNNDGLGNDVTLGILKKNTITQPNGSYTGCPSSATLGSKLRLVRLANRDPREIKGIVTLNCGAATASTPTPPTLVPCPRSQNLLYQGYCLSTPDDGLGNAVTIGVVSAKDAGDPYTLYGECNTSSAYGIKPGFRSKSCLIQDVGRSLASVRSIDLLGCKEGQFPSNLQVTSCTAPGFWILPSGLASHYDYCISGTDKLGNDVIVGVNKN